MWDQKEVDAFKELKAALAKALSLHHIQVDKPFVLRTDASGYAIGAVLEQEKDGALVPVCFCSRKLTTSQRNWTPRDQETYAIIMALRKWAGWIGFQFSPTTNPIKIGPRSLWTHLRGRQLEEPDGMRP